MDKAAVLIDGGYLDKVNTNVFGRRRIDLEKFSDELCKPDCVRFRTYYYHCPPYQYNPPTLQQRRFKASYDKFIHKIRQKPRFEVREGMLRLISRTPFKVEQKGVDVLLSCDLVRLAAKNAIEKAIIVGGDSDFVPAVKIAKEEMILTEVCYVPGNCSPHLRTECDMKRILTQDLIDAVSF